MITVDTLRADRLSSYGYRASQTPAMDRLAAEGARFSLAYCDIPWTTGSMSSVLTGTYGPRHGVQFPWNRLPDERLTLAEVLHDKGYVTGAVVASFPLDSAYGLDQGFDTYDDTFDTPLVEIPGQPIEKVEIVVSDNIAETSALVAQKMKNDAFRPDAEVTEMAAKWLREHATKPFFLWVHYFGPHEDIRTDVVQAQRGRMIDAYDGDVRESDTAIGGLLAVLEDLGLTDRTLVLLHADHGQELGEHGNVGHGRNLLEETVRVPVIIRLPGQIHAGTRVDAVVRNVDLFPTVLDYLAVTTPRGLDGRSLRPWVEGKSLPAEPAFMELALSPPIVVPIPGAGEFFAGTASRGMRSEKWKYITTALARPCWRDAKHYKYDIFGVNPQTAEGAVSIPDEECSRYRREELYEFAGAQYGPETDERNLAPSRRDVAEKLAAATQQIAAERRPAEEFELDEAQRQKLKSLGYLQ